MVCSIPTEGQPPKMRAVLDDFMRGTSGKGKPSPELSSIKGFGYAQWPDSLRVALRLVRNLPTRAALFAGPDLLVFCNQPLSSEIGSAAPRILGLSIDELANAKAPSGWRSLAPVLHTCLASGESAKVKDLDFGPVKLSADVSVVTDEQGRSEGVLCLFTLQPVLVRSPRRKAPAHPDPQQAAAIIRGSGDAIFSVDLEGRITSWNDGAARLYGYMAQDIIGRSIHILVPEGKSPEEDALLGRIREGHGIESYQTNRVHRSGRIIPVSLRLSPIFDPHGRVIGASKIARDISAQVETEAMREILMSEMKHRVKNTLATVMAIARQSFGRKGSEDVIRFTARIGALARAQDLLTREAADGAELGAVVRRALSPFPEQSLLISGPSLHLGPRSVMVLTLCLHELATNAAKYGALSAEGGKVQISWRLKLQQGESQPEQVVLLSWRERGGPVVIPPSHRGFGSVLINNVLRLELGALADVKFDAAGLRFDAVVPRERLSV